MKYFVFLLIAAVVLRTGYFIFTKLTATADITVQNDTVIKKDTDTVQLPLIEINHPVAEPHLSKRDSIVAFAKTLMGIPYLYASKDPVKGFDCSGFINYVFEHFNIAVPRSSYDFMTIGKKIALDSCKKGDLILFTGTVPEEKNIGHIGIVCDTKAKAPYFIHSSSGKANGVTITSMESEYYQKRFVTVVDILSK